MTKQSKHLNRSESYIKAYIKGFSMCIVLLSFLFNYYLYNRIESIGGIGRTYSIENSYTDDIRVSMNDLVDDIEKQEKKK